MTWRVLSVRFLAEAAAAREKEDAERAKAAAAAVAAVKQAAADAAAAAVGTQSAYIGRHQAFAPWAAVSRCTMTTRCPYHEFTISVGDMSS